MFIRRTWTRRNIFFNIEIIFENHKFGLSTCLQCVCWVTNERLALPQSFYPDYMCVCVLHVWVSNERLALPQSFYPDYMCVCVLHVWVSNERLALPQSFYPDYMCVCVLHVWVSNERLALPQSFLSWLYVCVCFTCLSL